MTELQMGTRVADLERQVQGLRTALATNRTIATAVGVLMATYRLDRGEAFALLANQSTRTNTKLGILALDLVTATELSGHQAAADAEVGSSLEQ